MKTPKWISNLSGFYTRTSAWLRKGFEEEGGKPSAKRKTLFAMVIYLGYVVVRYTTSYNAVTMSEILLGGILVLAGVAAYQTTKTPKKDESKETATKDGGS